MGAEVRWTEEFGRTEILHPPIMSSISIGSAVDDGPMPSISAMPPAVVDAMTMPVVAEAMSITAVVAMLMAELP